MSRPSMPESTVKRLFARSMNRCAFPGCDVKIAGDDNVMYGEICHIEGLNKGSARYNPNRPKETLNDEDNLVLMCPTHHTAIDSNSQKYPTNVVRDFKKSHELQGLVDILPVDAHRARLMLEKIEARDVRVYDHSPHFEAKDDSTQIITINNVKVSGKKRMPASAPTTGTVGADAKTRSYVYHLHDRLFDFMSKMPKYTSGRVGATIARGIKMKFGATWTNVPIERYDELVEFLKAKIDKTIVGKRNISHGSKNYSSYEEFVRLAGE